MEGERTLGASQGSIDTNGPVCDLTAN